MVDSYVSTGAIQAHLFVVVVVVMLCLTAKNCIVHHGAAMPTIAELLSHVQIVWWTAK